MSVNNKMFAHKRNGARGWTEIIVSMTLETGQSLIEEEEKNFSLLLM